MNFRHWFESEVETADMKQAPASAEVLRTGLQPQVGAEEIKTHQKDEQDKLMAADSHIQRLKQVGDSIGSNKSPNLKRLQQFCNQIVDSWEKFKTASDPSNHDWDGGLGTITPSTKEITYRQENQPPPETMKKAGPGTFGVM